MAATALLLAGLSLGVPVAVPSALTPHHDHADVLDEAGTQQLPADRQAAVTGFAQRYLDTVTAAPCGISAAAMKAALALCEHAAPPPSPSAVARTVSITHLQSSRVSTEPNAEEHLHLTFATSVGPLSMEVLLVAGHHKVRSVSPTSFLPECHRKRLHQQSLLFRRKHSLALGSKGVAAMADDDVGYDDDSEDTPTPTSPKPSPKPSPSPEDDEEGIEAHLSAQAIHVVAEPLIAF